MAFVQNSVGVPKAAPYNLFELNIASSLFDDQCRDAALKTFLRRERLANSADYSVVATVQLVLADGTILPGTASYSTENGRRGHAEKTSMARAINEFTSKFPALSQSIPILDAGNISAADLLEYIGLLSPPIIGVKCYTERAPCTTPVSSGENNCHDFFSKIQAIVPCTVHYSIPLCTNPAYPSLLNAQWEKALKVLQIKFENDEDMKLIYKLKLDLKVLREIPRLEALGGALTRQETNQLAAYKKIKKYMLQSSSCKSKAKLDWKA